ncbi:MAG TPA: GNAT family N-acetyltransferase [Candidatus Polarisedimenticolaceae bacterium]|nr:GNAT family N-acetyltransferase [Candidatus Polarisedimenticolaceae bacterium]
MADRDRDGARLKLREGEWADAPFIVSLGTAAFAPFGDYAPIMRSFLANPSVTSWIAEADGDPAGFALVETDPKLPGFADLVAIAVEPRHRRTGVGRALLGRVIDACEEGSASFLLVLTVAEDNAPAIGLFRAFGFAMVPGIVGRYAGGQVSRRMAKPLTANRRP